MSSEVLAAEGWGRGRKEWGGGGCLGWPCRSRGAVARRQSNQLVHPAPSLSLSPHSRPGIKESFLLHTLGCHPQPLPRASSPAAELEENVLEKAPSASGEMKNVEGRRKQRGDRSPGREFGRFSTA